MLNLEDAMVVCLADPSLTSSPPYFRAPDHVGAHGLLFEAHTDPDSAYSDAAQTSCPEGLARRRLSYAGRITMAAT